MRWVALADCDEAMGADEAAEFESGVDVEVFAEDEHVGYGWWEGCGGVGGSGSGSGSGSGGRAGGDGVGGGATAIKGVLEIVGDHI